MGIFSVAVQWSSCLGNVNIVTDGYFLAVFCPFICSCKYVLMKVSIFFSAILSKPSAPRVCQSWGVCSSKCPMAVSARGLQLLCEWKLVAGVHWEHIQLKPIARYLQLQFYSLRGSLVSWSFKFSWLFRGDTDINLSSQTTLWKHWKPFIGLFLKSNKCISDVLC